LLLFIEKELDLKIDFPPFEESTDRGTLIFPRSLIGILRRFTVAKQVILITGTPRVGKTSVAQSLAARLQGEYVNLTELAISENLVQGKDKKRNSTIVSLSKMKKRICQIIRESKKNNIIIDGHYAASVIPESLASYVFVLRRDPVELRTIMQQSGFSGPKLWENLASEILDVCLVDALNAYGTDRVCEVNPTRKTVEETVNDILTVLEGRSECHVGIVDWIGKLESQGLLDEYLKI
jgi:adenylate kinase